MEGGVEGTYAASPMLQLQSSFPSFPMTIREYFQLTGEDDGRGHSHEAEEAGNRRAGVVRIVVCHGVSGGIWAVAVV